MDIKASRIQFIDGTNGLLSIAPEIELKDSLTSWIIEKKFDAYIDQKHRMKCHSRKRNKLYTFYHPIYKSDVVLKVSKIDKQYNFFRRVNLLLSTLFNDYNFRAFNGSIELNNIGVNCAIPIAYWTESSFLFRKKSYYMYEKIEANFSLFSLSQELLPIGENNYNELYELLAQRTTNIVRQIHHAGFRQGDPHPGNFLIPLVNQKQKDLSINDINNLEMFIIDLDKFSTSKSLGPTLKRFFDLRCMRRCTLGPYNQYDMLKFYLRDEYSVKWEKVLKFWIHGGFNPFKWFRTPKRGQ